LTTPVNCSLPAELMFSMTNDVSATRVLPAVSVRPPECRISSLGPAESHPPGVKDV